MVTLGADSEDSYMDTVSISIWFYFFLFFLDFVFAPFSRGSLLDSTVSQRGCSISPVLRAMLKFRIRILSGAAAI